MQLNKERIKKDMYFLCKALLIISDNNIEDLEIIIKKMEEGNFIKYIENKYPNTPFLENIHNKDMIDLLFMNRGIDEYDSKRKYVINNNGLNLSIYLLLEFIEFGFDELIPTTK